MKTRILLHPDPAGGGAEPTAAQLRAEIDGLKAQLAAAVPGPEADKIRKELADTKKELEALKAAAAAPPDKKGFFPRLF